MVDTKELGQWGEEKAYEYLLDKGYTILARNYRCRLGELDIIAREQGQLVSVEVKTRRSIERYGFPCEAVNSKKRKHIRESTIHYMSTHALVEEDIRFDVIEILVTADSYTVTHRKGCF